MAKRRRIAFVLAIVFIHLALMAGLAWFSYKHFSQPARTRIPVGSELAGKRVAASSGAPTAGTPRLPSSTIGAPLATG